MSDSVWGMSAKGVKPVARGRPLPLTVDLASPRQGQEPAAQVGCAAICPSPALSIQFVTNLKTHRARNAAMPIAANTNHM